MTILLTFGVISELAIFALAIFALRTEADPFRLGLTHVWMIVVFLGALNLRLMFVAIRLVRGGGWSRADADGIVNIKDRIGPIAWTDVRGASIRPLDRVPRMGVQWVLFIDVPDAVAARHLAAASLLARTMIRPRSSQGLTAVPIMSAPPYTRANLEVSLGEIRSRAGLS